PSLQQAIKLLPMSTIELADMLTQEVVENPMLEEVPTEELQAADAVAQTERTEATEQPRQERPDTWDDNDYAYFFGDYLDDGYRASRAPVEVKELPPLENTLSTQSSLADHLQSQLSRSTDDPSTREVGSAIIGKLGDDGSLMASVDEIAAMGGWSATEVEQVLTRMQQFDPVGVAARDLQECLSLQLRHLNLQGTLAE